MTLQQKINTGKESQLQMFVFDTLRFYGAKDVIAFHPFNEGKRASRSRFFYERMGMLAGVADVVVILPGGVAKFLELKTGSGRVEPTQITFAESCASNGSEYAIARSPEEAAAILFGWGALSINPLGRVVRVAA